MNEEVKQYILNHNHGALMSLFLDRRVREDGSVLPTWSRELDEILLWAASKGFLLLLDIIQSKRGTILSKVKTWVDFWFEAFDAAVHSGCTQWTASSRSAATTGAKSGG